MGLAAFSHFGVTFILGEDHFLNDIFREISAAKKSVREHDRFGLYVSSVFFAWLFFPILSTPITQFLSSKWEIRARTRIRTTEKGETMQRAQDERG